MPKTLYLLFLLLFIGACTKNGLDGSKRPSDSPIVPNYVLAPNKLKALVKAATAGTVQVSATPGAYLSKNKNGLRIAVYYLTAADVYRIRNSSRPYEPIGGEFLRVVSSESSGEIVTTDLLLGSRGRGFLALLPFDRIGGTAPVPMYTVPSAPYFAIAPILDSGAASGDMAVGFTAIPDVGNQVCESTKGSWLWDLRAFPATLGDDRIVEAIDNEQAITGVWVCDATSRSIVVTWSTGFIDRLTISETGFSLTGTNDFAPVFAKKVLAQNAGLCAMIPGDWSWDTRAMPTTLLSDGNVTATNGDVPLTGKWYCTGSQGRIVVKWSSGFVDHMKLENDILTGFNQVNPANTFSAYRR